MYYLQKVWDTEKQAKTNEATDKLKYMSFAKYFS